MMIRKRKIYDTSYDANFLHVGFNANGAYFSNKELRQSYKTLEGQPINVDHDDDVVVGEITQAKFIPNDGVVISANV